MNQPLFFLFSSCAFVRHQMGQPPQVGASFAFPGGVCPRFASTETDEESRLVRVILERGTNLIVGGDLPDAPFVNHGSRCVEDVAPYIPSLRSLRDVEGAVPYGLCDVPSLVADTPHPSGFACHLPPLGKANNVPRPSTDGMYDKIINIKKLNNFCPSIEESNDFGSLPL